jgi:hypothetical protein
MRNLKILFEFQFKTNLKLCLKFIVQILIACLAN